MANGAITNYFTDRLTEASTWQGVVGILTTFGVSISPAWQTEIVTLGVTVASAIGALLPNKIGTTSS